MFRVTTRVLILYSLLSLGLTYPLILNLNRAVPNDIGDPLLNTWILAWDAHALLNKPLALFGANIYYPLPQTLAYSEHLFSTALLALPIQLVTREPLIAYNLSLLVTFPLAAFGMYLLALSWTGRRDAAFIAGLIFGFAPYRFAAIAHLQLLTFQWLPFVLLFFERVLGQGRRYGMSREGAGNAPRWRDTFALGLFLLLQCLASWYLAIYTGLIVILDFVRLCWIVRFWILDWVIGHWSLVIGDVRSSAQVSGFTFYVLRFILTLLLVALLIFPFAWPYLSLLESLREARPLALALSLAAVPTDFAAAAPFNSLFGAVTAPLRARPGFTEENTLFLGPISSLLALIALIGAAFQEGSKIRANRRVPPLTLTCHRSDALRITFLLLLLVVSLLLTFSAPYVLLARLLPASTVVRVPPRWIIPALLALAGLAALGFARVQDWSLEKQGNHLAPTQKRRLKWLFLSLCTGLLLAESWSAPLPLAPVENRTVLNPAYPWLAKQDQNFALVELPLHSAPAPEFPEVKRLYASTWGWWPLVNGYSGYTPLRQPRLTQALTSFPDLEAITALQGLKQEPGWAKARLLLLVHPGESPLNRSQWEDRDRWQAERNPALLPLGQFEGDYLYQVGPAVDTRFPATPLASFGQGAQKIYLMATKLLLPQPKAMGVDPLAPSLFLYWQANTALTADYTVFVHLRAADGFVRSQADGPPVSGHYPTSQWQPGEIIQDIHPLPPGEDFGQVDHLAIGLYDPVTGERLPAFDAEGKRLTDEAVLVPIR